MRARRWAVVSMTVLVTVALAACTADGADRAAAAEDAATVTAAPTEPVADDASDDAGLCADFGDVLTIVENTDLALAEGRMQEQERHGWYQLATRVLDRLPADGDTAVQTAIAALQDAAPVVDAGAYAESTGVRSPQWSQAEGDLAAACEAIDAPLAIMMFTGG